mmetsp:Transcript_22775/g.41191  ORF Transcript_22775/g.41191 Transcript_22775/m.41191 type:complete len:97 (+) Transcript_22775:139-429(+)
MQLSVRFVNNGKPWLLHPWSLILSQQERLCPTFPRGAQSLTSMAGKKESKKHKRRKSNENASASFPNLQNWSDSYIYTTSVPPVHTGSLHLVRPDA